MADIVYLLGAGINRCVNGPNGLKPPLSRDFFQQALRIPMVASRLNTQKIAPLFGLIEKYWRLKLDDLVNIDFDLEELFTFIELELREATTKSSYSDLVEISSLEWLLTDLIISVMGECKYWIYNSVSFQQFANRIWREKASVITFNYDTLLESEIESASPSKISTLGKISKEDFENEEINDSLIEYTPHEWHPYLAYKVPFDEFELPLPGPSRLVSRDRYSNISSVPTYLQEGQLVTGVVSFDLGVSLRKCL